MGIPVKLPVFEGPLDLLLHLIDINKFNIFDIPIVEITDQYMEYIRSMEDRDLNTMSEFLVMAATLLEIKARMLLPAEVDEEGEELDPREELVQKLLEYKMYKYMAAELKDRMIVAERAFYKDPTIPEEVAAYEQPVDLEELVGDLTLRRLNQIFQNVMRRQNEKIDPIRSKFGKIEQEEISLDERISELRLYAEEHASFCFSGLLEQQKGRIQVIVTFLAVLELMKTGELQAFQEHSFGEIRLRRNS